VAAREPVDVGGCLFDARECPVDRAGEACGAGETRRRGGESAVRPTFSLPDLVQVVKSIIYGIETIY